MMYYVCRPIDMWLENKEHVEIVKVSKKPELSYVCSVLPEEDRCYNDPLEAAKAALVLQKEYLKHHPEKTINIFVGEEPVGDMPVIILKTKFASKLLKWANREYSTLPKCKVCRGILGEQSYNHRLQNDHVFCSEHCASVDLQKQLESLDDNEETEFFL